MSIAFQCSCGKTITADERNAGHRVRCPNCAELLTVPTTMPGNEVQSPNDEEAVTAELVEDAGVIDDEPVEDDAFEVLEDEDDLPMVQRAKKRRKKKAAQYQPRRKTIQDELYGSSSPTFFGLDPGSSAKTVLYIAFVAVFGCCVLSLVCGVFGKIMSLK